MILTIAAIECCDNIAMQAVRWYIWRDGNSVDCIFTELLYIILFLNRVHTQNYVKTSHTHNSDIAIHLHRTHYDLGIPMKMQEVMRCSMSI